MVINSTNRDGVWVGVDDRGVATIEIDRPDRMNALDAPASHRLTTACEELATLDGLRVVVVSGRGRAFCAGADLVGLATQAAVGTGLGEDAARGIIENGSRLVGAVRAIPAPVIAAVDGPAVGIGASLAAAADLVFATERSYFLLAFTQIGLMPDGGATALFTASLGRARANKLALLAERLPANEAVAGGIVSEVMPDRDQLDAAVNAAVDRLLLSSPEALAITKSALDAHSLAGFDAAIEREIAGQTQLLQSPGFAAALGSFGSSSTAR